MKKNKFVNGFVFFILIILGSCGSTKSGTESSFIGVKRDTLSYFDASRSRKIPVAIYQSSQKNSKNVPIIFSHGYGMNHGDAYIADYQYLLEALAEKGYFVISVQHELTTDALLSSATPIREVRMPNWKHGALNIGYVIQQIKKNYPKLNYKKLVLIGHSNGGDQSTLFAHQHPELLDKLITMDNRRMDLPLTSKPRIYTLRSNDHPADDGVLPTPENQRKYKIIVQPTAINHDRMDKDANEEERKFIITKILEYLNEK